MDELFEAAEKLIIYANTQEFEDPADEELGWTMVSKTHFNALRDIVAKTSAIVYSS